MELRGLQGEQRAPLMHCQRLLVKYKLKRGASQVYATSLQGLEEERLSPALAIVQPMKESHSPAKEKSLYFQLSVYSNGFFVYISLPRAPCNPPPYKRAVLSLASGNLPRGFSWSLFVLQSYSPLFPNTPLSCW